MADIIDYKIYCNDMLIVQSEPNPGEGACTEVDTLI